MTDLASITAGAHDPFEGLLASLQREFDGAADMPMAREIVAREAVDFHWEARIEAVRLGAVEALDDDAGLLECWQVLGVLEGRWFVAKLLIDGDHCARNLLGVRRFGSAWDAYEAFEQ